MSQQDRFAEGNAEKEVMGAGSGVWNFLKYLHFLTKIGTE